MPPIDARSQHGQNGGVQSTRQEGAQRHVAHKLPGGCVLNEFACVRDCLLGCMSMLSRLQCPVGPCAETGAGQDGASAGTQLLYALEYAEAGRPRRAEQQDRAQTIRAYTRLDIRMAQHGLDLRAKGESVL